MNIGHILFIIGTLISSTLAYSMFSIISSIVSPFYEQCDSRWVTRNVNGLDEDLDSFLFGQDLAASLIITALRIHISKHNHRKPLVLNFHGWPGGGKSYVAEFIVKHWFRNGEQSKFVKKYFAKKDFPLEEAVYTHQKKLQKDLEDTIYLCPRAMFVFDEVDKYPPRVLDGIKSYLDYNSNINGYDYRQAIFIFISNTGEELITKITFEKWKQGVPREDIKLRDFEEALSTFSYNAEGGFYRSDLIKHHLIDFVVPFLPLERSHLQSCIETEFKRQDNDIPDHLVQEAIREIMEEVSYWPSDEEPLYPKQGCKNIDNKVYFKIERFKSQGKLKKRKYEL